MTSVSLVVRKEILAFLLSKIYVHFCYGPSFLLYGVQDVYKRCPDKNNFLSASSWKGSSNTIQDPRKNDLI